MEKQAINLNMFCSQFNQVKAAINEKYFELVKKKVYIS